MPAANASTGNPSATPYQYPTRKPELICILTPHRPAVFPPTSSQSAERDGNYSVLDSMRQFFSIMSEKSVEIASIRSNGMELEFDIAGVAPCIANALRRALLSEVPSMAPETVFLQQNSSILTDDNICSRLGLIPFRADPRRYKYRAPDSRSEHPKFAVIFNLNIPAAKAEPIAARTPKAAKSSPNFVKVTSGHLKYFLHPDRPVDISEADVRPIHEDILITTMLPQQELILQLHVVKGIGKDHAKFSPVATAAYRPRPQITILTPLYDEQARKVQTCFPEGTIDRVKGHDREKAVVKNSRLYRGGRKLFVDEALTKAVEIGFRENEFIFSVESIGALKSAVLVQEALTILKNRCEHMELLLEKIGSLKSSNLFIKMEDDS